MKYTNHHANVCVYVASIPAKNSRVSITPWCNHSFHNAVQPAAGHAGCPCWGILGVSACWYWRTEINRWVRIIPSWIATVQSIQLHMLNHYTEHTFFSSGYHASFLFHVFLPFLPGHVIMSLTFFFFYHAVELLLQSLLFTWHHDESFKRGTLPSGASVYQNAAKAWRGDKLEPRTICILVLCVFLIL